RENPVKLRDFKYIKAAIEPVHVATLALSRKLSVCLNEKHDIHHVRERGYVEAPVRISAIMKELGKVDGVGLIDARNFSPRHILAVHSSHMFHYMEAIAKAGESSPKTSFYPYVFPIRNRSKEPSELAVRAGYYCIDTFTPINASAFHAAVGAVNSTITAASQLLLGDHYAYALVRPPGHHAERQFFGGFCYFNNNAVAAHYLSRHGTVAILDIDYHHGNGQQQIFYRRDDVLTISIHGHPDFAYPYFCGFESEQGAGDGKGFNYNIPLAEHLTGPEHLAAVERALGIIRDFNPTFLIVACGFDTAANDPTGTWSNRAKDFHGLGLAVSRLKKPTLVVQEGGYRTTSLGTNSAAFFTGLLSW
ncbi:histone deacetylase family protein, partial [Myxococcota bacterium]|nr:histone deacetylase family protein [Myxococcota bacterium]